MNQPYITLVLPVYQNETSLKELHHLLKEVLQNFSHEILFVDDASPDQSAAVLKEIESLDPHVKVITLAENGGQNRAVLKGLQESRGSIAIVMDADLQDPPSLIPQLIAKLSEGYEAVFAGRHGFYESPMRLLSSKIFKYLMHRLCNLPKDASLFVAMNRKMIDALNEINMPKPFVVAMIGLTGYKNCSIPFIRSKQKEGKTAYDFPMRLQIGLSAIFQVIRFKSALRQAERQKKYYAKADHRNIFPENYPAYIRNHIEKAAAFLPSDPHQKILEVGCGMGRFTIPLAKSHFQVEGLDLSPELLSKMEDYCNQIPTHCANLLNPPSHLKGQFDVVIGFFILHHLPDLEKTFESIYELLKPDGRVIFIEPNPYNILFYFQIFFHPKMRWKNERHMLKMRRSIVARSMKNFDHFELKRFGFFPPFLYHRFTKLESKLEKVSFFKPFLPFQLFYAKKKS